MVSYILTGPVMNMAVQGLVAMEGGLDKCFIRAAMLFVNKSSCRGWSRGRGGRAVALKNCAVEIRLGASKIW